MPPFLYNKNMKKITPIVLSLVTIALWGASVSLCRNDVVPAKADSEAATMIFTHGTPGVDQFYNYCPTVMQEADGTRHVYYCTNTVAGNVTDYIGYRVGTLQGDGSYSYSSESIVLSPSSGTWDERHTCDPNVIKGSFVYNSHTYSYLMAYLGCVTSDNSHNEIGLAVADNPGGPFTKVDSLNPFKHFTGTSGYEGWEWGYGQASMISIDKAGQVLFTYTTGEKAGTGVYVEKWNLSNLNSPSQIGSRTKVFTNGLKKEDGTSDSVLNNADFAYDEASGRIYGIRDNHPSCDGDPSVAYSSQVIYVEPHNSDKSVGGNLYKFGTWKLAKLLNQSATGQQLNHNSCLVRDEYGHLNNPSEIEAIVTGATQNSTFWGTLSTYRLYSYKTTVNNTNSDYMLDVGANITYNYTAELDVPAFRMMPQQADFSSGNAISLRIRNNTGVDTPLRISFNCTNDSRVRALSNGDESKKYYLVSLNGNVTERPYRTWDGDVWLSPNFDGYLVMKKDDQVTDTGYPNQGVFSWNSVYAMFIALETHYDSYANYDVGDIYTCNMSTGLSFVKPVLQSGLVSEANTNSTWVLDYLGEGRININRRNASFISVVEFIDKVANINPCSDSSTTGYKAYSTLLSSYNTLANNNLLLSYFNSAYIYDFVEGDVSHTGLMTNKILVADKWNYIAERNNSSGTNTINIVKNNLVIPFVIIYVSISSLMVLSLVYLKRKKKI